MFYAIMYVFGQCGHYRALQSAYNCISEGIRFIYDVCMVICYLQTVCGVTEKHGYRLDGYLSTVNRLS